MIKVVSCFWNAEKYIGKCLESLQMQKFKDFKVYLIDDMSTDNSVSKIEKLIDGDIRFELIINQEKKFKLRNLDELIRTFDDDDVVIELDGDDWLYLPTVLEEIDKTYQDSSVWITNGSFMYSNGSRGFSAKCSPLTIRKDAFRFSHLRTWKAFLWKSIPIENLKETNGEYFKSGADVAYTFPLLELAGEKHYKFISSVLYVYNANSPYNDHKEGSASGGLNEQSRVANIIRKKTPLKQLFIE